jgi:hypothetical protein
MIYCPTIALNLNFLSRHVSEVHIGQGIAHVIIINDLNKIGTVIKIFYDKEACVEQNKTEEYANKLAQKMETAVISLFVKEDSTVNIICTHKAKGKICCQLGERKLLFAKKVKKRNLFKNKDDLRCTPTGPWCASIALNRCTPPF